MRIRADVQNGIVRVSIEEADALVQHNAAQFKDELLKLLPEGEIVLISLGSIRSLDSTGAGALVTILKGVRRAGAKMALIEVRPQVLSILETIRLTTVLDIFEDASAALAVLGAVSASRD